MQAGKAKHDYKVHDAYMLRVPSLPLEVLKEISETDDIQGLLREYYTSPLLSEALFLASPDLHRLAASWFEGDRKQVRDPDKLRNTLMKYLIRMASRCTPFGLFAGISSGIFSHETNIQISPPSQHHLHVRPDMQYLCSIAERLNGDQKIREKLKLYPNTSLAKIGDEYRFIEYFTDQHGIRKYQLQKTPVTHELEEILNASQQGAEPKLLSEAIAVNGVHIKEASAYVSALIDNQVLVSSLEPVVSGSSYLNDLLGQFRHHNNGNSMILQLNDLDRQCDTLNGNCETDRMAAYNVMLDSARESGLNFREGSLIQADLKMTFASNTLSREIQDDLHNVLPVLMKLSRTNRRSLLDDFREAFTKRYEMREVPLNLALDTEAGPGYLPDSHSSNASSLLEGLIIPRELSTVQKISLEHIDRMLNRRLHEALITGEHIIEITDADIQVMPESKNVFPISFSALVKILGAWDNDPGKTLIQLNSVGGSGAANLSGRFCYLDDRLRTTIQEITRIEQEVMGDEILAEIVHLPQQRTGNILMRPVLRDYEIPYLARAAVDQDFSLPLDDLMVSVRHNKVVLRSKKLNKYILPRLSNAHNFSMGSLPVYRFLCDLQTQGICPHLSFSWGEFANESIYLPRVIYKNFILHTARWNLFEKEIKMITDTKESDKLMPTIHKLRKKYHIPREVVLSAGDNELWIDLGNLNCVRLLQQEIKGLKLAVLHEFLFRPDQDIVKGEDGPYANECVFFFHKNPATER
ncbi:MAG: lantibiotic dehydratase family protein [Bacteroidota bacterium]